MEETETRDGGLAAAIDKIEALADAGRGIAIENVDHEPEGYYYLVKANGEAELLKAKPDWHSEKLATPMDLVYFIKHHGPENEAGEVYFDETAVTYVFDFADRRDRATCQLKPSEVWTWLREGNKQPYAQAEFVRLLRIALRGCLGDSGISRAEVRRPAGGRRVHPARQGIAEPQRPGRGDGRVVLP
jgi:hypothetical protein